MALCLSGSVLILVKLISITKGVSMSYIVLMGYYFHTLFLFFYISYTTQKRLVIFLLTCNHHF